MIHGHARIKLTNPISGNIIKDIEGENTFQGSVIAQGNKSLGSARAGYYLSPDSVDFWKRIVGGIFMFENSPTANDRYMSAGNRMVANGAYNVTNNGVPVELGSWNSVESAVSAGTLKMVYDWGTAQGNGTIRSVCLTSDIGGYIGYGNKSGGVNSTKKYFWTNQNIKSPSYVGGDRYDMRAICGNFQYRFKYDGANHQLTVYSQRIPLTQASVFDCIETSAVKDTTSLNADMWSGYGVVAVSSGGKIYLCPSARRTTVAGNASIHIWEYNPSNGNLTDIAVVNTSGSAILYTTAIVSHGKLFVREEEGAKVHIFDISDSTYEGYFEDDSAWDSGYTNVGDLPNDLTLVQNVRTDYLGIYDPTNDTFYPINATSAGGLEYFDSAVDAMCVNGEYNMSAYNNPLYLASIYNLPSAVTKDASMAMKVEYTLQEA